MRKVQFGGKEKRKHRKEGTDTVFVIPGSMNEFFKAHAYGPCPISSKKKKKNFFFRNFRHNKYGQVEYLHTDYISDWSSACWSSLK